MEPNLSFQSTLGCSSSRPANCCPYVNPLLNPRVLTLQDPMTVHCGFVGDPGAGLPGFHLDPHDSDALASCHFAVVSATFGASDAIHSISKSQARWKSSKHLVIFCFTFSCHLVSPFQPMWLEWAATSFLSRTDYMTPLFSQ